MSRHTIAAGVSLAAGLALVGGLIARRRFDRHLERLEAQLRTVAEARQDRTDLPPEVIALAARIGVPANSQSNFATFVQTGHMWSHPGGEPMAFSARQIVRVERAGFVWRALTKLPMALVIADYFVTGVGGLEVRALGAVPVAKTVGGIAISRGELLRYLAELPLNPDAILANRSLQWRIVDPKTIVVASGAGEARGEITFGLGDDGLISTARAEARDYASKAGPVPRPWHGRFWDYLRVDGRLIPEMAEVSYTLEKGDFLYWRGRSFSWQSPLQLRDGVH